MTRIYTGVLVLLILATWSLAAVSSNSLFFLGMLPVTFLLVLIVNAQWHGTINRSETGAAISGLIQLLVALAAAAVFAVNTFLLFVWSLAPLLVVGSILVGYGSYWMAWQNWVWVQQLRDTKEDDLPIPRTLSLTQLMLVIGAISTLCALAAMVKYSAGSS